MSFRAWAPCAATAGGTAARSVTIPATAQVGDLLILTVVENGGVLFTAPTGQGAGNWVERINQTFYSNTVTVAIWTKPCVSGDAGAEVTTGLVGGVSRQQFNSVYVVSSSDGFDAMSAPATVVSATVPGATATPVAKDRQVLEMIINRITATTTSGTQTTPPSGYTERADRCQSGTAAGNRFVMYALNEKQLDTAASVTPGDATLSQSGDAIAVTLTIGPKLSAVTAPESSPVTTWNIRQRIESSGPTRWNVLDPVQQTATTQWRVNAGVSQSATTGWRVAGAVTVSASTLWNARSRVQTSQSTAYAVRGAVTSQAPTAWAVRARVPVSRSIRWTVRSVATAAYTTAWSVRQLVSQPISATWNVHPPGITATATTRWRVKSAAFPRLSWTEPRVLWHAFPPRRQVVSMRPSVQTTMYAPRR